MPNPVPAAATGLPATHPRLAELIERAKLRKQVGRAVSRLFALLDELAPDPDLEPEEEGDELDSGEESLGWAANVRQIALSDNTADGDLTAPERHGRGFVRCGGDDMEPEPDAEDAGEDDDLSDKEPSLGAPEMMCQAVSWNTNTFGNVDVEEACRSGLEAYSDMRENALA